MKRLLLLLSFTLLVGCTSTAEFDLDDVVAEVMDEEVTAEDVYLYRYHRDYSFEQSVRSYAQQKVMVLKAKEHGFNMTEQEVDEEFESFRDYSGMYELFLEENLASIEESAEILNMDVEEITHGRYKRGIVESESATYYFTDVFCENTTIDPCPDTTEEFHEKMNEHVRELYEEHIEYRFNE
ncbi:hypothetical protein J2R98_002946 [Alkalibacillus filiformis]|uniref:Uncharacterized protein n=1 Tax=Alkalibacillus filiformis TaxID=200990 RepID=A0ABU0DX97_9BACI|nr:hypothetical protein [Alkalibacillus filiformis]MDQ0353085.1 hypothetical protein [Alkalibacillus filiformis]